MNLTYPEQSIEAGQKINKASAAANKRLLPLDALVQSNTTAKSKFGPKTESNNIITFCLINY